jgi:hypothetical protein
MKRIYTVLMAKREEKTPLGTPRRRWVGNIEEDLQEIERKRGIVRYGW